MGRNETPPGFTAERWLEYVKRGRRIMRRKSAANFEMGDTLIEMIDGQPRSPGEIGRIFDLYAKQLRSSPETLKGYRHVARAWPEEMRRPDVPWTVHRELVPDPNRFRLIREEPSDELDPQDQGVWHTDTALRARHSLPQAPKTPQERIDRAKHMLRVTDEAAEVVTQLVDRTEVINRAVEDPRFRRAVREANRERGQRLEEAAEVEKELPGPPPSTAPPTEDSTSQPSPVNYREAPSAILKILGSCTSFCVSLQNAVVLLQEESCNAEEEEAVLDSIRKVRTVCDWCEHAVTTGQADMDEALAQILGNGAEGGS